MPFYPDYDDHNDHHDDGEDDDDDDDDGGCDFNVSKGNDEGAPDTDTFSHRGHIWPSPKRILLQGTFLLSKFSNSVQ